MPSVMRLLLSAPIAIALLAGQAIASTSDSLAARHTTRYDLYAPTSAQLDTSAVEIEHAIGVFTECFGEQPPRIAVVVLDSPDALRHIDLARFRAGGIRVLPWVTTSYLANGERNLSVHRELGAVLSWSADRGLSVLSLIPTASGDTTKVSSTGLLAGDVIRTVDGAPIASIKSFEDHFDAVAPGHQIALEIRRGDATQTLRVIKRASSNGASRAGASPTAATARALSHEVGHMLLISWVEGQLGRKDSTRADSAVRAHYGSDVLPDWLDEAFATLCEFPALQARRKALMAEKVDQRIPLAELFTMSHPVAASQQDLIARAREQMAQGQKSNMIIMRGDTPFVSDRSLIFYAECLSVAQFMAEHEGSRLIGRIAAGLVERRDMAAILSDARQLPRDIAALEAAWVAGVGSKGRASD